MLRLEETKPLVKGPWQSLSMLLFVLSVHVVVSLVFVLQAALETTQVIHLVGKWDKLEKSIPNDISGQIINWLAAFWQKHAGGVEAFDPYIAGGGTTSVQAENEQAAAVGSVLERLFENKKKLVAVDMAASMRKSQLDQFFPLVLWPSSTAVRELATQAKSRKFVCADIKKYALVIVGLLPMGSHLCVCRFLPPESDECVRVYDHVEEAEALKTKPKSAGSKLLDIAYWQVG